MKARLVKKYQDSVQLRRPRRWGVRCRMDALTMQAFDVRCRRRSTRDERWLLDAPLTTERWLKIRPRLLRGAVNKSGVIRHHDLQGQIERDLAYGAAVQAKHAAQGYVLEDDLGFYVGRGYWCFWRIGVIDAYLGLRFFPEDTAPPTLSIT